MSKRIRNTVVDDGKLCEQDARNLLYVLGAKYGFCLPPLWRARLERNPPRSIDKFLDTVFHAEGLNPFAADSGMYHAMREEVRRAFERSNAARESPEPGGAGR